MYRKLLILFCFCFSISVFSADTLKKYSQTVHPMLDEVVVFHEDKTFRYRALIFREGYEHVTAYIIIQKFSVNYSGKNLPYKLITTTSINEVNQIYNFGIEKIIKNESGFTIILDGVHSHLNESTTIEIKLFEDLKYEIVSGLVSL